MNYKLSRIVGPAGDVLFGASGHLRSDALNVLRDLLAQEKTRVAIDLAEVSLVNRETVIFLAAIETRGVELLNCPAYVREWIERERSGD